MKFQSTLAATVVTLASTVCLAYPKVGDMAEHVGTYLTPKGDVAVSQKTEILSYDAGSGQFGLRTSREAEGKIETQDISVASGDLVSKETVTTILSDCAGAGGIEEKITVPAGDFNTCKLTDTSSGDIWVGDVPFGIVRNHFTDASGEVTFELKTYKIGQ